MAQALAPKHAMKMGYRRHGRIWREIDAMNMAWTASPAATMVRPLVRAPIFNVRGDP
jgi:hypothetical protein